MSGARPGFRMAVVTTAHPWGDPRVFERSLATCLAWGVPVHLFISLPEPPPRQGWAADPRLTIHLLPVARGRLGRFALALGVWRAVLGQGPFQLVHFHDPELMPAMALLGLLWPETYTLCDIHEDLPLQLAAKPYLPDWARMPAARLTRWMHRLALGLFSGFAPASEAIARQWPSAQTRVLHNYPKALFAKRSKAETGPGLEAGLRVGPEQALDPHRVLYVGGLAHTRGIPMVLEAMRLARRSRPLRLELVGRVLEPEVGRAIAAAVAEGWCRHWPWLAPEALAGQAAGAGIGLVTLLPLPNYLEALPTKLFEYMAMGIPVLASAFPLWRQLVEAAGAGQLTEPEPAALAQALLRMSSDPPLLARYAEAGRAAYRQHYRWEVEAHNLRWHLQQAGLAGPDPLDPAPRHPCTS